MSKEEMQQCGVCDETKLCRYCRACKAWICEPCWRDVPGRAIAAYIRLKRKVKAGTLWKEMFNP